MDQKIFEFSQKNGLITTRYADDFSVSSNKLQNWHVDCILKIVKNYGFAENVGKRRFYSKGVVARITGLNVCTKVDVTRSFKRKMRAEIFTIKNKGLYAFHKQNEGDMNALFRLYGRINYLKMVGSNEDIVNEYYDVLNEIFY